MGRIGSNSEISEGEKSELVLQICSMSTIPIACPHKNHSNNTHFIDWYRLLGVCFQCFLSFSRLLIFPITFSRIFQSVWLSSPPPPVFFPLQVAENAGFQLIKRRYHNLALQLHPDKNKHPKAEIAFKLVSEAYACVSDGPKRRAFNIERWKHF
ncbi:uncharacterized protein LOC120146005 isoform X1 [Hibiscus syriacus]|uniref:uncharacterized protein LOC120146005 isoform X1 n=1 Tax=Hibiscus syriacus TaxID=106335 RepID=UPI0019207AEF|nr:uncharacterized protein LOC120146005 isoform X1 [Hibiscus syriacus]